ncbi:hypothetical protein ACOMHN_026387 [Nucella lapillus]
MHIHHLVINIAITLLPHHLLINGTITLLPHHLLINGTITLLPHHLLINGTITLLPHHLLINGTITILPHPLLINGTITLLPHHLLINGTITLLPHHLLINGTITLLPHHLLINGTITLLPHHLLINGTITLLPHHLLINGTITILPHPLLINGTITLLPHHLLINGTITLLPHHLLINGTITLLPHHLLINGTITLLPHHLLINGTITLLPHHLLINGTITLLPHHLLINGTITLPLWHERAQTFDFFIVMVSFLVDIVFMQILPRFKIQDFVFILAFLLPWRVIRVVNSLVVAVQDHEHFRLKMMYSRKKKIQNSLREAELKLQLFKAQCCALKRLCLNEGVEEEKIEAIVQLDEYVVNKTGKSKCKIRIDNSSVILLDKCDFPRLSPRPSLASLWEKRKSFQADASGVGKSDKFSKRNGHMLTADDALGPDVRGKGKGRKSSFSFSNGPFSSLFGSKDLHVVPEVVKVRRAGSQGQICEAIKRDFLGVDRKVKRGSSHNQLCQVTVTNEMGGMTSPVFPDDRTKGSSMDHLPGKNPNAKNIRDAASDTVLSRDCDTAGKNLRGSGTQSAPVLSEDKWTQTGGSGGSDGHTVDDSYEKGAHRSDLQNTDSSAPSIPNKHLDVATAGTGSPFLPCPCPPVSPKQKRSASLPTERISVLVTQHDDQPYIQKTRANSLGPGSMHIIVECPRNTSVSIGSAEADPAEFQHQEENHKPRTVSEEMSDVSKDVGVSEDSPGTVLTGEVKQSSNSPENPVSEVREVTGWYLGDLDESSLPPGPGQHSRSQDHSQTAGTSSRQSGFLSDDQVAMPDTSEDDSQSPSADRVIQGKVVRISSTEATNQGSSREHVNDAISEKDS